MTSYRHLAAFLLVPAALVGPLAGGARAQPSLRIELYTMGPGDYLFSKFGHAALCAVDPDRDRGLCYNYGTADFSTPGPLTWAVLRGRAEFWVSVADRDEVLAFYRAEDRTIYRQVLPLREEQAAEMARALATDALPENRRYRYNHFLDNCSTRPRDHIDAVTEGALRALSGGAPDRSFTFRALVRESLGSEPVFYLLTEAFVGREADRERSQYEAMFLPHLLREGVQERLHAVPELVYSRRASLRDQPSPIVVHLTAFALGVGIMGCLALLMAPTRLSSRLQKLFACPLGAWGLVTWLIAVLSPLPELRHNELLIVIVPMDFFLLFSSQRGTFLYAGIRLFGLALVLLLVAAGVFIQPLGPFLALVLPVFAATIALALARSTPAR